MIPRQILGPQEQFERTGAQSLRDIRPFTARLSEALRSSASGVMLGMAAVGCFFEPAAIDIVVPASIAYAAWVLTRRVALPMLRLPRSSGLAGLQQPDTWQPKAEDEQAGSLFIGWAINGQELWVTAEDARQHITIPGTTGAGKTTAIMSLLCSSLAQGSGFVLVDGKADRSLFGTVLALARRFGREDDVRVLNFMVASGLKDSHTFNAFATGNADAIRELLASQLGDAAQNDANGVFRERAVALIGTIAPVLVWLRDHKGVPLNIDVIRFSIELRWIWKLAMQKIYVLRNADTGKETEIDVNGEIPEEIIWPLKAYLGELPGYDPTMPLDKQKGDEPSKQHGFAQFYFTATFTQLAVSLGHIFRCEMGDIDMRDIVLNRRILVVNLPALENSDATLAALGKLVVASLRGMMAQLLGASLEGDYTEADKPGMGPSPFPVVLDELAYYATSGLDRMLAMGRGSEHQLHARLSGGVRHLRAPGRKDCLVAWQREYHDRHAPAGFWANARLHREDRRPDQRHPGHVLPRIERRQLSRSPACGGSDDITGGLERSDVLDRGRGDRPVRRPTHLRPRVPRKDRRHRAETHWPQSHAAATCCQRTAHAAGTERVRSPPPSKQAS